MNWQVKTLAQAEYPRWDAFVLSCPSASFFHRAAWQSIITEEFQHRTWFLYAEQQGQIGAVLPLAQLRSRWFGNTLVSLPFCVYGGIASQHAAAAQALDVAAQALAQQLGVDHLEYRHRQSRHPHWQHKPLYATFRRALVADDTRNLNAIPRKQRAMIRKGETLGLHAVIDADTERLYRNYAYSVHQLGTPVFSRNYFRRLQQAFGQDCVTLSVEHQGQAICSVLSFRFRDEILPYYAGGTAAARALAGNDVMYWQLMCHGAANGARLFDFGRSKLGTGAFAFKKNWGFQAVALEYDYLLCRGKALADVQPLNPRFQFAIRCWRLLPLALANRLGPHIVRQLG